MKAQMSLQQLHSMLFFSVTDVLLRPAAGLVSCGKGNAFCMNVRCIGPRLAVPLLLHVRPRRCTGEVAAFNQLIVTAGTDARALGRAVIARVRGSGHTALECYGLDALGVAVQVN